MADWNKILSRGNVDDRRGSGVGVGGGLGIAGVVITLLFSFLSGTPINVNDILGQLQSPQTSQSALNAEDFKGADQYETFVSTVLGSTNDYWKKQFSDSGLTYVEPKLTLFRTATQSGCGFASSEVGPHYCPADGTIYIDETFFAQLQQQFQAKGGDVAEAYVIAHEVGHHVQNQLGTMKQVGSQPSNETMVNLELQADCYAGNWAHSVAGLGVFEQGEISEALDAAAAVGDDRIQKSVTGQVSPETWTHGSSEQRTQWFTTGYTSGDPMTCDTFNR